MIEERKRKRAEARASSLAMVKKIREKLQAEKRRGKQVTGKYMYEQYNVFIVNVNRIKRQNRSRVRSQSSKGILWLRHSGRISLQRIFAKNRRRVLKIPHQ